MSQAHTNTLPSFVCSSSLQLPVAGTWSAKPHHAASLTDSPWFRTQGWKVQGQLQQASTANLRKLKITWKEPSNGSHIAKTQGEEKKSLTKKLKNICLNCILTVHQVHTYTFKKQEKVIMFQPRTPQNQKHQRHKTYIRYKYVWENMLLQRIIRICWRRRQNFDIQQLFMKLMFFHILEYPTRAMMSLALQWEKHVSTVHGLSPSVSNSY